MFPQLTPVTKNIIILNVIFYLVSNLVAFPLLYDKLSGYFPLSPNFEGWQIVTHMFMHASFREPGIGILHIVFNMVTLWSFGPVLEQTLGEKKFLILYFAAGLGGFFFFNLYEYYQVSQYTQILNAAGVDIHRLYQFADLTYQGDTTMQLPSLEAKQAASSLVQVLRTPMVGASGAIFGVVAAFATLFPDLKLIFMFIPFPIKAKYLFPLIIIGSLYLGLRPQQGDSTAHFAHIGGAIIGCLIALSWRKNHFRVQ